MAAAAKPNPFGAKKPPFPPKVAGKVPPKGAVKKAAPKGLVKGAKPAAKGKMPPKGAC